MEKKGEGKGKENESLEGKGVKIYREENQLWKIEEDGTGKRKRGKEDKKKRKVKERKSH